MNRKPGRGNRWGLAVVGLVLAILGGSALARGLGAFPQNWAPSRTTIVDANVTGFVARTSPWIWWLVALAGLILVAVGLRWLIAQWHREGRRTLCLHDTPTGVTDVSAKGMARAVADDAETGRSVLRADARLLGSRADPEVRLRMTADESAPLGDLTRHLTRVVLPNVRDALDRDHVRAVARVSLEPPSPPQRVVH
ncbi:hypothetical protein SAMN05421874_102547 [Nonomuraea maritima]|uniref:Alkaline shock response membrane anchor protein AmaP n=1 Tax=Nonomuraea maritima TaxID=683260 RepID=A0A1G8VH54_9ACTN|nr:hypothetical protein [Nonomuraea maritima]SDJ64645.1 hypothetical protein SAMN05421874_102547 [Nonomuraea maritima]